LDEERGVPFWYLEHQRYNLRSTAYKVAEYSGLVKLEFQQ
jgi:hypothetical protein